VRGRGDGARDTSCGVRGLLDPPQINLAEAGRRLRELHDLAANLLGLAALLAAIGTGLAITGSRSAGIALLVGAASALARAGLCRADRRRLLVRLVAQGDERGLAEVAEFANQLCAPRERARMANGLRVAAQSGKTGAGTAMMVDPARASDCADRLMALADAFGDPRVPVSASIAAICRRLLCDAAVSPLYNPRIPECELPRVLELLERGIELPDAGRQDVQ